MEGTDNLFMTKAAARARLAVALGGRAAEEVYLGGECTQGAQGDLAMATELANSMVRQFGMTERGLAARPAGGLELHDRDTSDAVESLLSEAMETARETVRWQIGLVQKVAEELLERGTLHGEDLDRIFGGTSRGTKPPVRVNSRPPEPVRALKSGGSTERSRWGELVNIIRPRRNRDMRHA